ncbi:hypothetical protein NUW58_g7329 [Xylaria curta]|uniref:Uncharacterized protein n=1 Tax=Xylaria curta TaxID=42375 RepID=A0ACC1NJI0_9PEZI|nr:hypothetical protein NUW58_g7329 [Xylaria curta]
MAPRDDYLVGRGHVGARQPQIYPAQFDGDIVGRVLDAKEGIRIGDIIVSKLTAVWPGVIQYDVNGERAGDRFIRDIALDQPIPLLLTATGKAEAAAVFDESRIPSCISEIPREIQDPVAHYSRIASGHHLMRHGAARDKLAHKQGVLRFEAAAADPKDTVQYLAI